MLSEALELISLQNRVQAVERFENPSKENDKVSKEVNSSAPLEDSLNCKENKSSVPLDDLLNCKDSRSISLEDLLHCKDSRSISIEDLLHCKDSRSISLEDLVATNPLIVDHIDHHGRRCGVSQRDEFDAMMLSEMCKGFYSSNKCYNRKVS